MIILQEKMKLPQVVSIIYTPKILEQDTWWILGKGMPENSPYNLLIASLEPRKLNNEPQERRHSTEEVIYASREGRFPEGIWFITLLFPQEKEKRIPNPDKIISSRSVRDGDSMAWEVIVGEGDDLLIFVCRRGEQTNLLDYQPLNSKKRPYDWSLKTDADLLCLRPIDQRLKISIINGTLLQINDKKVISLPYRSNKETIIETG